jgi:hypothetical protein
MRSLVLLAACLSAFAFACSVAPAGQDLTSSAGTEPNPSPAPDAGTTCSSRTCPAGESTYATVTACTSAGAERCAQLVTGCGSTVYCGRFATQCTAKPACDAGDAYVDSCDGGDCYTRTACGTSIICRRPTVNCDAYPTCDPGDYEPTSLATCNEPNVSCYSRTVCGSTIWCVKVK